MPRLFVAVALPEDVKDQLAALCSGVPGAKWRSWDQFHLTLRFIGDVDGAQARDVLDCLQQVRAGAFGLQLQGAGHFGDRKRPRVLWAGVGDGAPLQRLHDKIDRALMEIGLDSEHRKYKPHVTLARLQGSRREQVESFAARHGDFQSRRIDVDSFVLFSSFLSASGAIYTAEAEYPLRLPAVAASD